MANWRRHDDQSVELLFGKHSGEMLQDIPRGYLSWLVREHNEKGSFDEDLILHVEEELAFRDRTGSREERENGRIFE